MIQLTVESIGVWLWALTPFCVPGILIVGMWRAWSHSGEFELSGNEILLRFAIFFALVAVMVVITSYFLANAGRVSGIGWDSVAL